MSDVVHPIRVNPLKRVHVAFQGRLKRNKDRDGETSADDARPIGHRENDDFHKGLVWSIVQREDLPSKGHYRVNVVQGRLWIPGFKDEPSFDEVKEWVRKTLSKNLRKMKRERPQFIREIHVPIRQQIRDCVLDPVRFELLDINYLKLYELRVFLPVCPTHLVESEVKARRAVAALLRSESGYAKQLACPDVIAYESNMDSSALRYEWILLGATWDCKPLKEVLPTLSRATRLRLLGQWREAMCSLVVRHQPQRRFEEITGIYPSPEGDEPAGDIRFGPLLIKRYLFSLRKPYYQSPGVSVSFGPWRTSNAFIRGLLDMKRWAIIEWFSDFVTDNPALQHVFINRAHRALSHIERAIKIVDFFFPLPPDGVVENTYLSTLSFDDDEDEEILVDRHGNIKALGKWENTALLPLCFAVRLPTTLEKIFRDRETDESIHDLLFQQNVIWSQETNRNKPSLIRCRRQYAFFKLVRLLDLDQQLDVVDQALPQFELMTLENMEQVTGLTMAIFERLGRLEHWSALGI